MDVDIIRLKRGGEWRLDVVKNTNKRFNVIGTFLILVLIIVLDCDTKVKIVVIVCLTLLYFGATLKRWSKEKWVIVACLCSSIINAYCEKEIYIPYRTTFSAAYNSQTGFGTTQLCYVYNARYADALIPTILKDRKVSIYGNCKIYQKYFEMFSGEVVCFDSDKDVDYFIDRQHEFMSMGIMCMSTAPDCFEDEEMEILGDVRDSAQLYLSLKSDKIIK